MATLSSMDSLSSTTSICATAVRMTKSIHRRSCKSGAIKCKYWLFNTLVLKR
jgi:hypothetical protein